MCDQNCSRNNEEENHQTVNSGRITSFQATESLRTVAQPCLQRGVGKPSRGVELEVTYWVSGGAGLKGRWECEERLLKQGMAQAKAEAWEVMADEPPSMNIPPSFWQRKGQRRSRTRRGRCCIGFGCVCAVARLEKLCEKVYEGQE